jgi:hypothetical protein
VNFRSRTTVVSGLLATGLVAGMAAFALAGPVGSAGTAGTAGAAGPGPVSAARPDSAARTSFPGLSAPTGEPELASIRAARPRIGQILQVQGPFDDRFVLERLVFDGSAVSGAVLVTSDVSDVLELQVLAGFHDRNGDLLGTGRFVHHLDEGHPHAGTPQERTRFTIPVPAALAHRAVSVTIGVPVLVNE